MERNLLCRQGSPATHPRSSASNHELEDADAGGEEPRVGPRSEQGDEAAVTKGLRIGEPGGAEERGCELAGGPGAAAARNHRWSSMLWAAAGRRRPGTKK
jgi:hypothetical protein